MQLVPRSAVDRTAVERPLPLLTGLLLAGAALTACSDDPAAPTPPPDLASSVTVEVDPAFVGLPSPGDTARLTADVQDAHGASLPEAAPAWASTDRDVATVGSDGVVSGEGPGEARVVATYGEAADTTRIEVGREADDSTGADALHPNEPSGFTAVSERAFASREENGWRATDNPAFSIAEDPTAPVDGPHVGQVRYSAGMEGGRSPSWTEHAISGQGKTSIYVSFRLKVSDNWQGHFVNDKLAYFWVHGRPVVFPVYVGGGGNPLTTEVRIQDVPDGGRNLRPNVGEVTIERGEWHHWEVLLVNNEGDRTDGEIHWWIDGEPIGAYEDVRFSLASQSKIWDLIAWRPVWGGAGGEVQEDMYMWMDHIYVSGSE